MALTWCSENDIRGQLSNYDSWAKNLKPNVTSYIEGASGEAASYLGKYRYFFTQWNSAAPRELSDAVAVICSKKITGANATLAPGSMDETYWEREYERVIDWLKDVQAGRAEIYVDWPNVSELEEQHSRARLYTHTSAGRF